MIDISTGSLQGRRARLSTWMGCAGWRDVRPATGATGTPPPHFLCRRGLAPMQHMYRPASALMATSAITGSSAMKPV